MSGRPGSRTRGWHGSASTLPKYARAISSKVGVKWFFLQDQVGVSTVELSTTSRVMSHIRYSTLRCVAKETARCIVRADEGGPARRVVWVGSRPSAELSAGREEGAATEALGPCTVALGRVQGSRMGAQPSHVALVRQWSRCRGVDLAICARAVCRHRESRRRVSLTQIVGVIRL